MAKKTVLKTNKFKLILLIVVVVVIFLIVIISIKKSFHNQFVQSKQGESVLSPSITITSNSYYSELLGVSITVPDGYSVEDELGTVTLTKSNNKVSNNLEIILSRIGTNDDSLEGYLLDIAQNNKYTLTNKINLIINNYPAIKVDINGDTTYLIYIQNQVYYFETKSPELYSDLDQIARSFRYTP